MTQLPRDDQDLPPGEPPPGRLSPKLVQLFAAAIELPVMLVAGIVIGGGAGWWLDHHLGTAPVLMLVLGVLGFAAGLREILRKLSKGNS